MKDSTHHSPSSCRSKTSAELASNGTYSATKQPTTMSAKIDAYTRPSSAVICATTRQTMTIASVEKTAAQCTADGNQ